MNWLKSFGTKTLDLLDETKPVDLVFYDAEELREVIGTWLYVSVMVYVGWRSVLRHSSTETGRSISVVKDVIRSVKIGSFCTAARREVF